MEELDGRKVKILEAIIQTYLETCEPVGSRTISKFSDLNLSSATIRNEMSDLEELGYIMQPHTSAGRIPSDRGYRFYVDHLVTKKNSEISEMKEFVIEHTERMEQLLQKVAKVLAQTTNYATMITSPMYNKKKVKFIQLSQVDSSQLLAVVVMEGNLVKNKIIATEDSLDSETLLKLNFILNSTLNGLTVPEINLGIISKLKEQAGEHDCVVDVVLKAVSETISKEELEIYTSGATNIFRYPELSDSEKASELIYTLEEKQQLASLVSDSLSDDGQTGIQVYIGTESPIQTMKDCSVVTATYELGDGVKGTVGIIGPKRMDYEKVMDNLKELTNQLDGIFKNSTDDT